MADDLFKLEHQISTKAENLLLDSRQASDFKKNYQELLHHYIDLLNKSKKLENQLNQAQQQLQKQNNHIDFLSQEAEKTIYHRTKALIETQNQLRKSIGNLRVTQVSVGIYWLQIPEANLYILCGCPAESVKHLMRRGFISTKIDKNISYETGPNAILLSDLFVQNGNFSNMAEFPVLHMLYRQGMILPEHPNNTDIKPILLGNEQQLRAQLEYIRRGNYGLFSEAEIIETGIDSKMAKEMMKIKHHFAFGQIKSADELLDQVTIDQEFKEIRNGVKVRRIASNQFEFFYRGETVSIDLNLPENTHYSFPYTLDYHHIPREYFAIVHSGEGDGWDLERPSMGSLIIFQGRIYLIDAPPNITYTLEKLGIDISEVHGVFHTHIHDDHFSGLPNLILSSHKVKYFATAMVRSSTAKKLAALLSMEESCLEQFFDVHDLILNEWNDCDGMQVLPLYSPHPVENNFFIFKADDKNGSKTYAHLADLTQFSILEQMNLDKTSRVDKNFINKIKSDYLIPANVKKIDIGGGLIHGIASDFVDDTSEKILMAHTARPLTNREKEIGSAAPFGSTDILIPSNQNFLRRLAFYHLHSIFPTITPHQLDSLLIAPVLLINPGSIIRQRQHDYEHIDMILTGVVEYIHDNNNIAFTLSSCSLIGEQSLYSENQAGGTWRALSHVNLMRFSSHSFKSFLERANLKTTFIKKCQVIKFLFTTHLFGEKLSYALLNTIASATRIVTLSYQDSIEINAPKTLFLIRSGQLSNEKNLQVNKGEFLGEENFIPNVVNLDSYQAMTETHVFIIEGVCLEEIPIIFWKLLDQYNKKQMHLS